MRNFFWKSVYFPLADFISTGYHFPLYPHHQSKGPAKIIRAPNFIAVWARSRSLLSRRAAYLGGIRFIVVSVFAKRIRLLKITPESLVSHGRLLFCCANNSLTRRSWLMSSNFLWLMGPSPEQTSLWSRPSE